MPPTLRYRVECCLRITRALSAILYIYACMRTANRHGGVGTILTLPCIPLFLGPTNNAPAIADSHFQLKKSGS